MGEVDGGLSYVYWSVEFFAFFFPLVDLLGKDLIFFTINILVFLIAPYGRFLLNYFAYLNSSPI